MNGEHVASKDRGKMMAKWRATLGWSVAECAKRIEASTRTVSAFESGAQVMPDARWRLLVHEVSAAIAGMRGPELVVVMSTGQTPLDVVSSDNYAGYALSEDGKEGMIASHCISRLNGSHELHRQLFKVRANKHVIDAIQRWEAARQMEPDQAGASMYSWLMRRVLQQELMNPALAPLKAAIADAKAALDKAVKDNKSELVRAQLLRAWDVATANLMGEVARATGSAGLKE